MDFKKAFDTVPHKRLISKLNSLNISKEIVNWIEAFISNRRQKVAVNGKESNWHDVTSGIPQGTGIYNIYDHEYVPNLLKNNEISQRTGNRGHSLKLFTQRAKLNLRKHLFPIRITEPWNSLPDTVVTAKSLNSSKTRLDKFWYNQDIVYDFEAPLRITNNNRTGTRDLILIDNENEELITEEDRILRPEPS